MALDTSTRKTSKKKRSSSSKFSFRNRKENAAKPNPVLDPLDQRWNESSNKISSLTIRILSVNMIALMILGFGILYLGQYTDSLIEGELELMRSEARFYSAALSEGSVRPVFQVSPIPFEDPLGTEAIKPSLARGMVMRLGAMSNSRVKLFSVDGSVLADSYKLNGPGSAVQIEPLKNKTRSTINESFSRSAISFLDLIPTQTKLQDYPRTVADDIEKFPNSQLAMQGYINAAAWKDENKKFVLTAAAPVQRVKQVLGIITLTKDGTKLENKINQIRLDVFRVFLGSLGVTVMLSIYLAEVIGNPLKRLAIAAESVRIGKNRDTEIPDMSNRGDEIGELSIVLKDMTHALRERMDAVDRFAADVSHELKNPLSSIRSAVETVERVKDEEKRKKLMGIIHHDVQRLDRLITDISSASRLDAELSRDKLVPVNVTDLLSELVSLQKDQMNLAEKKNKIDIIFEHSAPVIVRGNAERLNQVFTNLITNAISFSSNKSTIEVFIESGENEEIICVKDQGIGIPENKLEAVFERFYTERPDHENYGNHSGLGLSISKQIIDSHNGRIWAENSHDDKGNINGAIFYVALHSA